MQTLWYANVDFDLDLSATTTPELQRITAEAHIFFALMGQPEDRIICDMLPGPDYFQHLAHCAIPHAVPFDPQDDPRRFRGVAWGNNGEAARRFAALGVRYDAPDPLCVKAVNSRLFSAEINQRTMTGVPNSRCCCSQEQVCRAVADLGERRLVIKPLFGYAGMGFIQARGPQLSRPQMDRAAALLHRHHGCVVEPWLERLQDFSSACMLRRDGRVTELRHHLTLTNRGGAYYGLYLDPDTLSPSPVLRRPLSRIARAAAEAAFRTGYYGPLGLDAFTYTTPGNNSALAACIEINARYTLSAVAYRLQRILAPNRHFLCVFAPSRRYGRLKTYADWYRRIGEHAFDPATRTGLFPWTPLLLQLGTQVVRPRRFGFCMAAKDYAGVMRYNAILRNAFSKREHHV